MVLEQELQSYSTWFPQALWNFGETAFFVVLAAYDRQLLSGCFSVRAVAAGDRVYRAIIGTIVDLIHISPRRVWALARLAIQKRCGVGFGRR